MEDPGRPIYAPPGLEFLGREPPSAARIESCPKRELGLSFLGQTYKGVSSEQQSSYFAEYRQGRIPGSPGLDDLRANANLGNAPSTIEVGSARRVLFASDASRSRDPQSSAAPQPEKARTGAGDLTGSTNRWAWFNVGQVAPALRVSFFLGPRAGGLLG